MTEPAVSGPSPLESQQDRVLPPPVLDPEACDFCHASIANDAVYHRLTVGMNSDGQTPCEVARHVEEVSEMLVCASCQKTVEPALDRFLEVLWRMRRDPNDDASPPTLPDPAVTDAATTPDVVSTPLGFVSPQVASLADELLEVAARAYPPSPAGFALGTAIGNMMSAGVSAEQIHALIDNIIERASAALASGASA